MSLYNILSCDLNCPFCKKNSMHEVEFKFGFIGGMDEYKIGENLNWGDVNKRSNRNPKFRPDGGNYIGEGYTVCNICGRDFFVTISIVHDVISTVVYDPSKKGYVE